MDLSAYYRQLYIDSLEKLRQGGEELDLQMNSRFPGRTGITLRIRPSAAVRVRIGAFLDDLKQVDPAQYYYPDSDRHITVLSVISAYDGFALPQIHPNEYIRTAQRVLAGFKPFALEMRGITASSGAVMIQGFFADDCMNELRDKLRDEFKNSSLQQSMDSRYRIQTAHSTVVRFRSPLNRRDDFLQLIEQYREVDFGHFTVDGIELVYNDWYHRREFVRVLAKIAIG